MCCDDMMTTILRILFGGKRNGGVPDNPTTTTITGGVPDNPTTTPDNPTTTITPLKSTPQNQTYRSTLEEDQQTTALRHRHYCHYDTEDHYNGRERTGSLDSLPLTEASSSFHRTSSWDFSEEETDQEVFVLNQQ
ncbi:uncharacterized protein LOC134814587 [Bolinopsis microptera]|uniref:uncharacterized protein LOC134814587 n=1 Tax=Bolinopsis microptera TaxID=2820187 RepID=UPI00307985F1